MAWYDFFSNFYDQSVEKLYVDARKAAAVELSLSADSSVLDCPCGTGQSFDGIIAGLGPTGRLIGLDASSGMLRRAHERVGRHGWGNVELVQQSVLDVNEASLPGLVDRVHVFLGLSTFPDWPRAFDQLWAVLRPGGLFVIVDVHAEKLTFQGWMVNLVARADIRRKTWEPLQKRSHDFARIDLPYKKEHGGQIFLARGQKPKA